jgi:gliding motility-associated-like protein
MRSSLTFLYIVLPFLFFAQLPVANFTANPTTVCAGECVTFTSTSSTNGGTPIVQYNWAFGDGGTATQPGTTTTAVHCFQNPGTYPITLVVTNQNGQSDSEFKPNFITVKPKPTVGFSMLGASCTIPLTLSFNNTSQTGPGFTYGWNFGNGQTSNLQNPLSQTYNTAGTVNVSLTVTDSENGCSNTITQPVVVSNYQAGLNLPQVACIGQPITISDASTAGVNAWNWQITPSSGWTFENSTTPTSQNPSVSFSAPGTYTVQISSQNTTSGCTGSTSATITVQPTPVPSFTGTPTNNCAPSTVNFVNTSTGGVTYVWDFGNGVTFTGANPPAQVYPVNGEYNVSLTMTTSQGCSGTTTQNAYIKVFDPTASFTALPDKGCNPLNVQFTSTSTSPNETANPIVSWNWNFGGGTPNTFSGETPPVVTYGVGIYDVTLTITTQSGCTATITQDEFIKVGQINSIDFTVDTTVNCIKTDFQFTSFVSTTPPNPDPSEITYFWDFTDGTSTDPNPLYQFTSDTGYFKVTLIVDFRGCKDTLEIDSLIYINAPIAKFSPEISLFCNPANLPVTLNVTDEATHGVLSDDVLMIWKWGDDSPNTVLDDPDLDDANLGSTSHVYTNYGSYTIEQVIHNYDTGCSDSTTRTIHVSQVIPGFTYSNDSICRGDTLFLQDLSSTWNNPPTPHPLDSWVFAMGNGNEVTGANSNYVYPDAGNYTITLTATNSVGCSAQTSLPVIVLTAPFSVLAADVLLGCEPLSVNFTNSSMSLSGVPLASFAFTFTDDNSTVTTTDVNTPVNHVFYGAGTHYAELVATDEFGCFSGPAIIPITITKPNCFFSVENVICNGQTITTENTTTGTQPVSYEWQLNGQTISTESNASTVINVTNPGSATSVVRELVLIATDGNGCKDTLGNLITISLPRAIPDTTLFGLSTDEFGNFTCPPVTVNFTDLSESYGSISSWNWNFGGPGSSIDQNPSAIYSVSGVYTAILTITDEFGCTDDTVLVDFLTIGGPQGDPEWIQNPGICAEGALFVVNDPVNVTNVQWTMGDGNVVTDSLLFQYNYENPGTYPVSVILFDALGCQVPFNLPPLTVVDGQIDALFTASPVLVAEGEPVVVVDQSSSVGSSIVSWTWNFGDGQVVSASSGANQSNSYSEGGNYNISLTVVNAVGCQDTYTIPIQVTFPELWVPNVFTPNGDGSNDLFLLPFDAMEDYRIIIVNRWGNVMWDRNKDAANPLLLWDGTDNGGAKATDGVYFYHLTGRIYNNGPEVNKHGFVTVVEPK